MKSECQFKDILRKARFKIHLTPKFHQAGLALIFCLFSGVSTVRMSLNHAGTKYWSNLFRSERMPLSDICTRRNVFGRSIDLSFLRINRMSAENSVQETYDDIAAAGINSTLLKLRKLRTELDIVRKEHGIMNNNTDELAPSAQYGGNTQFALASLKKRKLYLKDRISMLEKNLEKKQRIAKEVLVNPNKTIPPSMTKAQNDSSRHRSEVRILFACSGIFNSCCDGLYF